MSPIHGQHQVGLLGSFTTFSAVAVEVTQLLDSPLKAISYAVVSIGAGVLVAVGGLDIGERIVARRNDLGTIR